LTTSFVRPSRRAGLLNDTEVRRELRAPGTPSAFTLVELLVITGIIALLITILLPVVSQLQAAGVQIKCANNLRQLGFSMLNYASEESNGSFPRTKYDPKKDQLQLDNAGYMVEDSFGNKGYVGENNVPASLFLLLKTQKISPWLFICPSQSADLVLPGEYVVTTV